MVKGLEKLPRVGAVLRAALAAVLAFSVCVPVPALAVQDEVSNSSAVERDAATTGTAVKSEAESSTSTESSEAIDDADSSEESASESENTRTDGTSTTLSDTARSSDSAATPSKSDSASAPSVSDTPASSSKSTGLDGGESDSSAVQADSSETVASKDARDDFAAKPETETEEAPVDIADDWKSGKARVDVAGDYVLSADVTTETPLVVALPEGESATIDLAGHDVTVQGAATRAVDLTLNKGSIEFTDSVYSDKRPGERSSITIESSGPKADVAAVWAVRALDTRGTKPRATFEHVELTADVVVDSAESYGIAATAVNTGVSTKGDVEWDAEDETDDVRLKGCALVVSVSIDEESEALENIAEAHSARGMASLIEAGCRGIMLDGSTYAELTVDGDDALVEPMLLSTYASSYTLCSGFKLVGKDGKREFDRSDEPAIAFGFPSQLAKGGQDEAVVAKAAKDEVIPVGVAGGLKASDGYAVRFEKASGADGDADEKGFVRVMLTRVALDAATPDNAVTDEGVEQASDADIVPAEEPVSELQVEAAEIVDSTPHVYASYLAANHDKVVYANQLQVQSDGVDLNTAWKAQVGGVDSAYTIVSGGTYYLSSDLATTSNLVIDADGKDVTIKFNGRTLTIDGSGAASQKTMVSIVAAKSVTLDGAPGDGIATASTLKSAGKLDVWGINSTAAGCALSANDLTVMFASTSNSQRNLYTHAVRIGAGSLSLQDCTVSMNMGNQTLVSDNLIAESDYVEAPSAVFATSNVTSVVLDNCTITGEGPQGFSLDDVSDADSLGNAYAVYSQAASTRVIGGSYKAVSLSGNATCLRGTALEVAGKVALEANAAQLATGVLSTAVASVTLNAPISFAVDSDYDGYAEAEAALRTSVDGGFKFGDCAPDNSTVRYPALVLKGNGVMYANAAGDVIGVLTGSQNDAVVAALSNALGDRGCSVVVDAGYACFAFDGSSASAVASVTDAASITTNYPSLSTAIAALADGDTLALLADVGDIEISNVKAATIDMESHAAASLTFSTGGAAGAGLVVKDGVITGGMTAVTYSSASPLTLRGMTVNASAADSTVYGIYATASAGSLTIDSSTTVTASASCITVASSPTAYGVYLTFDSSGVGPAVVVNDAEVKAVALSASVSAYGVYNSVNAMVTNSAISASGCTNAVAAAYVGGSFTAIGSSFDAYSSDVGTAVSDVWMRTTSPVATNVTLDACTLKVRSAVPESAVAGLPYSCILGASSDVGTSAPSGTLTLSGATTLASVGGLHLGMNLGNIALGEGFEFASGSDSVIVVSQAKNDDAGGISISGATSSQMALLAGKIKAKAGSYYDGWSLVPDVTSSKLAWTAANGADVVSVVHDGVGVGYGSFAAAIAAAKSGDTVQLLRSFTETGTHTITQRDLALDLNGKTLTVRGRGDAAAGSSNAGGALAYTGSGTFAVKDGRGGGSLDIELGVAVEPASGAIYQGIAVSGGGTLSVDSSAAVRVDYTGSTSASAVQRNVVMRGVAVANGSVEYAGTLWVNASASDGGLGAMDVYGIFTQPTASASTSGNVTTSADARILVTSLTAAQETKNTYYAESTVSQGSPPGLREITVDPTLDADFYNDVVKQFRISATYDDPTDNALRNNFGAFIYYADNMQLDHDGKWYDGLKLWAYTDEVTGSAVGTAAAMVPSHVFISTGVDVLPNAYGVASGSGTKGRVSANIEGKVEVACGHGNAYALDAKNSSGAVYWYPTGAELSSSADDTVHPIAQGSFDLRDFIDFKQTTQSKKVAYSNTLNSKLARYEGAVARDINVGDDVTVSLRGEMSFATSGLDTAVIDAPTSFRVYGGFALAAGSEKCSVLNSSSGNVSGSAFARPTNPTVTLDPSWFVDATGSYVAALRSDGWVQWADPVGYTVTFKVGDAVVARYIEPKSIDLSEPSALAQRVGDQRQTYSLVGWSTCADENATSGYLGASSTISPTADVVYHAVYETGLVSVPVSFANVFDGNGDLQPALTLDAQYGQTVGEALEAAGKSIPSPKDYTDASGVKHHFIGWYPSTSSSVTAAQLYSSGQMSGLEITLALNGMPKSGSLTLRATYLATQPGQSLVTFVVDNRTSSCVVNAGARPVYRSANAGNTNYTVPSKVATENGKTFKFESWFVDSDGDGSRGESEVGYTSILPKVTGIDDYVYAADWSWEWSDVTLTFCIQHYDEATQVLDSNFVRVINTTYETSAQTAADTVEKIGNRFGFGGQVYAFRGWSIRSTDVDPIYDENNPIPDVTGSTMANTSYAKTYYGVYSVAPHTVKVTFVDGSTTLGTVTVPGLQSIDKAFAATGAAEPVDKSSNQQFLGWAVDSSATAALDGVSTTLEDIPSVGKTGDSLTLYAIYGIASDYTIRLRSEDGSKTLYRLTVRKGRTVNAVAAKAGVSITAPSKTGYYFTGWRTAAGAYFDLDSSVQGSANLYASYNAVSVASSSDASDISVTVTSTLARFEQVSGLKFTLAPRDSAEFILRSLAAENGYTILKSYDMRLVQTDLSGKQSVATGDFGSAAFRVYIGTAYRNTRVRAFWVGSKNNTVAPLCSSAKTVDSDGYVTFSIGSYMFTDTDEGGNLALAYIEGGSSNSTLGSKTDNSDSNKSSKSGKSESSSGKDDGADSSSSEDGKSESSSGNNEKSEGGSKVGGSSDGGGGKVKDDIDEGSSSGSDESASDNSSDLGSKQGGASVSPGSLGSLKSSLSSPLNSSLPSRMSNGLAGSGGVSGSGNGAKQGSTATVDGKAPANGADAAVEEEPPFFDGWDSDAVALIVLAAVALTAMVYGLWRLVVVRQRRNEVEAELPTIGDRYAEGIRF